MCIVLASCHTGEDEVSEDADNELPEVSDDELRMRVIYSILGPAAKLARRFMVSLKELTSLFEMACYHELKRASLTLDESAEKLGISRRKVAQLSKRLKTNFFQPEQRHGLPRRIEYMLWAGAMTQGRIRQALPEHDAAAVDEALDELVRQERVNLVQEEPTRKYAVPEAEFRLYQRDWMARIDGLNNLLANLTDAVVGRFFDGDERSFARTLNFRIRREDVEQLEEMYEQEIWDRLVRLEKKAEEADDDEVLEMSLSAIWAPSELAEPSE